MGPGRYNKSFYSKIFEKESGMYYKIQEDKIKIVLEMLKERGNGRMLDIGCGDGYITKLISRKTGCEPHGIDISRNAVKIARKRGIRAKEADMNEGKIPYPDDYFDVVFCGDILEHIYDTEVLLDNIHRVLKPGGCMVVSVPNIASWYNRVFLLIGWMPTWIESSSKTYTGNPFLKEGVGHIHAFTEKSLKELIRIKGFKIERTKGSPIIGCGKYSRNKERIWNAVDRLFSKKTSLSSTIIIKARKQLFRGEQTNLNMKA
jgi:methionine biosynthesis protein MetW